MFTCPQTSVRIEFKCKIGEIHLGAREVETELTSTFASVQVEYGHGDGLTRRRRLGRKFVHHKHVKRNLEKLIIKIY